ARAVPRGIPERRHRRVAAGAQGRRRAGDAAARDLVHRPGERAELPRRPGARARSVPPGPGRRERAAGPRDLQARRGRAVPRLRDPGAGPGTHRHRPDHGVLHAGAVRPVRPRGIDTGMNAVGLLERAIAYALVSLDAVAPPLLSAPTPCAGWDLRTLVDHLNDSVGVLCEGIATGRVSPAGGPDPGEGLVVAFRVRAHELLGAVVAAGWGD